MLRYVSKPICFFGVLVIGLIVVLAACSPNVAPQLSQTPAPSNEQRYRASVDAFSDRFYAHRKEHNARSEQLGVQAKSATTEAEYLRVVQQTVLHLETARGWFKQDREDFAQILPPLRFLEFHLLMNSVLGDYVESTTAHMTFYSRLSQGTQDLVLANRGSELLRTANVNLQRAGYMYGELLGQK